MNIRDKEILRNKILHQLRNRKQRIQLQNFNKSQKEIAISESVLPGLNQKSYFRDDGKTIEEDPLAGYGSDISGDSQDEVASKKTKATTSQKTSDESLKFNSLKKLQLPQLQTRIQDLLSKKAQLMNHPYQTPQSTTTTTKLNSRIQHTNELQLRPNQQRSHKQIQRYKIGLRGQQTEDDQFFYQSPSIINNKNQLCVMKVQARQDTYNGTKVPELNSNHTYSRLLRESLQPKKQEQQLEQSSPIHQQHMPETQQSEKYNNIQQSTQLLKINNKQQYNIEVVQQIVLKKQRELRSDIPSHTKHGRQIKNILKTQEKTMNPKKKILLEQVESVLQQAIRTSKCLTQVQSSI